MASYKDQARLMSLAPSPAGKRVVDFMADALSQPRAPSPHMHAEAHVRNGRDVVAALMLDQRTGGLIQAAIDGWMGAGGLTPFQSPVALPPRQEAHLQRRMSALVMQNRAMLPLSNAPASPKEPAMALRPVTRQPSADRLHARARTDLATYLAGVGGRPLLKSDEATPPKAVQAACRRGLDLMGEFGGPGLTEGAKGRARSMAAGNAVSDETLRRMASFFARHRQSRADPSAASPTPGAVAWLLWGGDAGAKWAASRAGGTQKAAGGKKGLVEGKGVWRAAKDKARGKSNPEAYAAAVASRMMHKAAGDRGGKVIGYTRSQKAIYAPSHGLNTAAVSEHRRGGSSASALHQTHQDFTARDHLDAAEAHAEAAGRATDHEDRFGHHALSQAHSAIAMGRKADMQKSATYQLQYYLSRWG